MKTANLTDNAINRINDMRNDSLGTQAIQKDNLLSAFTDTIRMTELAKENEDLQPWAPSIGNIQRVLCDYWEMRRDIEETPLSE